MVRPFDPGLQGGRGGEDDPFPAPPARRASSSAWPTSGANCSSASPSPTPSAWRRRRRRAGEKNGPGSGFWSSGRREDGWFSGRRGRRHPEIRSEGTEGHPGHPYRLRHGPRHRGASLAGQVCGPSRRTASLLHLEPGGWHERRRRPEPVLPARPVRGGGRQPVEGPQRRPARFGGPPPGKGAARNPDARLPFPQGRGADRRPRRGGAGGARHGGLFRRRAAGRGRAAAKADRSAPGRGRPAWSRFPGLPKTRRRCGENERKEEIASFLAALTEALESADGEAPEDDVPLPPENEKEREARTNGGADRPGPARHGGPSRPAAGTGGGIARRVAAAEPVRRFAPAAQAPPGRANPPGGGAAGDIRRRRKERGGADAPAVDAEQSARMPAAPLRPAGGNRGFRPALHQSFPPALRRGAGLPDAPLRRRPPPDSRAWCGTWPIPWARK